jgi:hypothetical protein
MQDECIYGSRRELLDIWGFIRTKFKEFLKIDSTNHRIQHNFKISPKGSNWNKICELFSVDKSKCVSAISIYNESTNPENTWDGHYEYAVYRPDDAWRGKALNKFEIQPIIDVNKLPEHHYLPFEKAEEFVNYFRDNKLDFPLLQTFPCLHKIYNMYMKITPVY